MAYGLHPEREHQHTEVNLERLRGLCERQGVVAMGEVGLDYLNGVSSAEGLASALKIAKERRLPVVIYCRDAGDGQASRDCLRIMRGILDEGHPVHRHSFSGDLQEFEEWQKTFWNMVFGFTATILREDRHPEADLVIQKLDSGHLLLESNAPYLPPNRLSIFNKSGDLNQTWFCYIFNVNITLFCISYLNIFLKNIVLCFRCSAIGAIK